MNTVRHPFDPLIFPDSEILILGSFPSLKSFENSFYYGHPRNFFWPILEAVYEIPLPDQKSKITCLKQNRLALWDMIAQCARQNSLDSNLAQITPNDIPALLLEYSSIRHICFTGQKAQQLFLKHFKEIDLPRSLLPSPSPAYCAMSKEEKIKRYQEVLLP